LRSKQLWSASKFSTCAPRKASICNYFPPSSFFYSEPAICDKTASLDGWKYFDSFFFSLTVISFIPSSSFQYNKGHFWG
jgi:hypothetical protein